MSVHLLKRKTEMSYLHKYYLVEAPRQQLQPRVFLDMTQQALYTWIKGISAILLWKSSQAQDGWGPSVDSHFQVSPEMFNRVQVRALAGPH